LQLGREPVDLGQVLAEVHRNLSLRAQEKGIYFQLDVAPVTAVIGDPIPTG
jgi:hypothetical protein